MVFRNFNVEKRLFFLIGQVHAGKDEDGAEEEPDGNLLVEQPPGKEDGSDGVEINPVGGNHSTKLADDPVPTKITDHRGNDT